MMQGEEALGVGSGWSGVVRPQAVVPPSLVPGLGWVRVRVPVFGFGVFGFGVFGKVGWRREVHEVGR